MATRKTKFLAEVKDKKGAELTISFEAVANSMSEAEAFLKKEGYEVEKISYAKDHHICKYCGKIVESSYEDLLCASCRYTFGHSLYSEL